MNAEERAYLARLEERIRKLESHALDTRSRIGYGAQQRATVLQIVGGQALSNLGLNGIKVAVTAPTTIPAYDLTTLPTTVDGIGYGTNVFTGNLELIGNCPPSWHRWDLIAGMVVEALAYTIISGYTVWSPHKIVG